MERAPSASDGFTFRKEDCEGTRDGNLCCDTCRVTRKTSTKYIKRLHTPNVVCADISTNISYIANDPMKARIEIEALREENQRLRYENARKVFEKDMKENCKMVSRTELEQVKKGMDLMNNTIESALEDGGAHEELEIWHLHFIELS